MNHTHTRTQKKAFFYTIALIIMGTSLFFLSTRSISSEDNKELIPTLFIHGYKGGPRTFGPMMERFEDREIGQQRMVVVVSSQGRVTIKGGIPHKMNPFIQVLFQDDRASVADQTYWLKKVLYQLHEKRGIDQVNLVAHSMGGLASTNFLLNNSEGSHHYPKVNKLAVIATPFRGIQKEDYFKHNSGDALPDLKPDAEVLTQMKQQRKQFDPHTQVLAIAGVMNEDENHAYSDGLVTVSSALGIRDIVPKENYKEAVIYDEYATHSGLHESKKVDALLAEFLWDIQSN
ncbi:alpha/beta hydrolase [Halobacillus rhizosphaerae]|uniref:alpha/beta hydrolase n=1 Tax=Halobacillus rhizosphaerae TaxID=3064889 RepID=UPI00398A7604